MEATTKRSIRCAEHDELGVLASVLVRAFANDTFHYWLFPPSAGRAARQYTFFTRVLSIYQRYGLIRTTDDQSAVALWDPPRDSGPSLGELLAFAFRVLPLFGKRAFGIARGMAPMASLHPEEPHWYLSILGTDPDRQRTGAGAALLTEVLARCDEDGTCTYLEASRAENVPYYERFGFELVAPLGMPDGPTIYRMRRDAARMPRDAARMPPDAARRT